MLAHFSHFFRFFSYLEPSCIFLSIFVRFFAIVGRFLVVWGWFWEGFGWVFAVFFGITIENDDFVKNSVSPRREHDLQGFEA